MLCYREGGSSKGIFEVILMAEAIERISMLMIFTIDFERHRDKYGKHDKERNDEKEQPSHLSIVFHFLTPNNYYKTSSNPSLITPHLHPLFFIIEGCNME